MKPYDESKSPAQVRRMGALARAALEQYPLDPIRIEPICHGENTVFRVTARREDETGFGRYALRIHVDHAEYRSAGPVRSELQWLRALRHDAGLPVPEPIPARDGDLVVRAGTAGVPGERSCTLLRWVEGREIPDRVWNTPALWRKVGELLARMHTHAERYAPPAGFVRHRYDAVTTYYGIAFADVFADLAGRVPADDLDELRRAVDRGRAATLEIGEDRPAFGLIHGDLHTGNCLSRRGELWAIDFDDCGFGPYAYDLAVGPRGPGEHALREAFLAGYRGVRPLPEQHERHLPVFRRMRRLNLFVWAYGNRSNNTRIHGDPAEDARHVAQRLRESGP